VSYAYFLRGADDDILHLRIMSAGFLDFDHRLVLKIQTQTDDQAQTTCKYNYFVPNSYAFLILSIQQLLLFSITLDLRRYLVSAIVRRLNRLSDVH
jgi:hypothetical protein